MYLPSSRTTFFWQTANRETNEGLIYIVLIRSGSITDQLVEVIKKLSKSQQEHLLTKIRKWAKYNRDYPRQNWQAETAYSDNNHLAHGMIANISSSGLYLQPGSPFSVGQNVVLSFEHPLKEKQIKVNGIIVRSDKKGIGVKFDHTIGSII